MLPAQTTHALRRANEYVVFMCTSLLVWLMFAAYLLMAASITAQNVSALDVPDMLNFSGFFPIILFVHVNFGLAQTETRYYYFEASSLNSQLLFILCTCIFPVMSSERIDSVGLPANSTARLPRAASLLIL